MKTVPDPGQVLSKSACVPHLSRFPRLLNIRTNPEPFRFSDHDSCATGSRVQKVGISRKILGR